MKSKDYGLLILFTKMVYYFYCVEDGLFEWMVTSTDYTDAKKNKITKVTAIIREDGC